MTTEITDETHEAPVLDFDRLENDLENLRSTYRSATPYPHIVLDDFLVPEAARAAIEEFPPLDPEQWNNYLHTNERKFSHTEPETWGPTLREILSELNSPRFVQFVSELIGVEGLIADPSLEGGGLHQSTRGGYLNIHADFTVHPHNRNWQRRANILLYLNDDWKPEYGGDLELWSADMQHCVEKVSPVANRVLIFSTDGDSFHGHPDPMQCPRVRSTEYRARPGDGAHSLVIFADTQMIRAYDWGKRHLGISDQTASKILGFRDRFRRRGSKN
jgi:hypothetical protein